MLKESSYTPEEQSVFEGQRTLSDAELIRGGAKWEVDQETKTKRLVLTDQQVEKIHQSVEELIEKGVATPENIQNFDLQVSLEDEHDIGYEFELEEEQRIMVAPQEDFFENAENIQHNIDTYDQSGRCRVRLKNGKPRISIKVPLLSRDTDRAKACIRLEFKPRTKEQEEDLLKIRDLILREPGTQVQEKWGVPLNLANGEKVWMNRNANGEYWIETDESWKIEDLLPESITYLGHQKSKIRMGASKASKAEKFLEELSLVKRIKENLNDPEIFRTVYERNLITTSRTSRGTSDTSVSDQKEKSLLAEEELIAQVEINKEKLLQFILENSQMSIKDPVRVKELILAVAKIVNAGIVSDPAAFRTWEVKYAENSPLPGELPEAMDDFYESLLQKIRMAEEGKIRPAEIGAWIEYEIDKILHPFADGCGRISKAISALILSCLKSPLPLFDSRENYYAQMKRGENEFRKYYQDSIDRAVSEYYAK